MGGSSYSRALSDVIAERLRQRTLEGWTLDHDDGHRNGEMAKAAACYAAGATDFGLHGFRTPYYRSGQPRRLWPWAMAWWKPKDRRRDLVRAGALIIAEIERLDRLAQREREAGDV